MLNVVFGVYGSVFYTAYVEVCDKNTVKWFNIVPISHTLRA
jgi:hypothetical protein